MIASLILYVKRNSTILLLLCGSPLFVSHTAAEVAPMYWERYRPTETEKVFGAVAAVLLGRVELEGGKLVALRAAEAVGAAPEPLGRASRPPPPLTELGLGEQRAGVWCLLMGIRELWVVPQYPQSSWNYYRTLFWLSSLWCFLTD